MSNMKEAITVNSKDFDVEKSNKYFESVEDEGRKGVFKYLDRIHDKLFNLNNLVIATYVALLGFKKIEGTWFLIIPVLNLIYLLYVDYSFADVSRMEARIRNHSRKTIDSAYKNITRNSMFSLISTIVILSWFLLKVVSSFR